MHYHDSSFRNLPYYMLMKTTQFPSVKSTRASPIFRVISRISVRSLSAHIPYIILVPSPANRNELR